MCFSTRVRTENSIDGIYSSLDWMDRSLLQRLADEKVASDQGICDIEGLLGLAMAALKDIRAEVKMLPTKQEPKKATMVLMEDNLTKAREL